MDKKKKNNRQNVKQEKKQQEIKQTVKNEEKKTEETINKAEEKKVIKDTDKKEETAVKKVVDKLNAVIQRVKNASPEGKKTVAIAGVKVVLPILAAVIVIATIVSLVKTKNDKQGAEAAYMTEVSTENASSTVSEPLEKDAYPEVNAMAEKLYKALADGDMETVKSVIDYIDDIKLIQLEKTSEYIDSYKNITCYTKKGLEENTYFLYVTYDAKLNDAETLMPGLMTYYVYTAEDGTLKIDGDMEENINAALKIYTSQDDVVDLFNKIDVEYKEAVASDEELNTLMTELSSKIKTAVGEELAKIEVSESAAEEQTETTSETEANTEEVSEEQPQTQIVNEQVRTTDTVNVRSSDSGEADKIGRVEEGTVLTRVESRINGWSKVIYENKEAFIKSDYLEVIAANEVTEQADASTENTPAAETSTETTTKTAGTVTAKTNVNVRNAASQTADTIGVAKGGSSYKVLENTGDWLKIEFKGQIGFVKAEFFE